MCTVKWGARKYLPSSCCYWLWSAVYLTHRQRTTLAMFLHDLGSADGLGANCDIHLQHHLLSPTQLLGFGGSVRKWKLVSRKMIRDDYSAFKSLFVSHGAVSTWVFPMHFWKTGMLRPLSRSDKKIFDCCLALPLFHNHFVGMFTFMRCGCWTSLVRT